MPRERVKRKKTKTKEKFSGEDIIEEMVLIEAVLGQILSKHAKIKKDLHETRVLLFIILGLVMALFGLVVGTMVKALFP